MPGMRTYQDWFEFLIKYNNLLSTRVIVANMLCTNFERCSIIEVLIPYGRGNPEKDFPILVKYDRPLARVSR